MKIVNISPPFVVYAEETPNPSVMKFVTDKLLLPPATQMEFEKSPKPGTFPLGEQLFRFPFIDKIYVSSNYFALHKKDFAEWTEIYQEVRNFISEFLNKNGFVVSVLPSDKSETNNLNPENIKPHSIQHSEPANEIENKIIEILDHYIRPGVESDGGFIAFRKLEEKKLYVELRGSCRGCPSSRLTLKNGIEALMKRLLPDAVEEVVNLDEA
ncbi:MAG: NifU family protein [Bacteroidia bacterium]|nr:NifU family protein [Bacteroidia bacterium]